MTPTDGMNTPELMGLYQLAQEIFEQSQPIGKKDSVDTSAQTKNPDHILAELDLAKLQSGEVTGRNMTEVILNKLYVKEQGLQKELKKLNKKFKKSQRRLGDSELSLKTATSHIADLDGRLENQIAASTERRKNLQKTIDLQEGVIAQQESDIGDYKSRNLGMTSVIFKVAGALSQLPKSKIRLRDYAEMTTSVEEALDKTESPVTMK